MPATQSTRSPHHTTTFPLLLSDLHPAHIIFISLTCADRQFLSIQLLPATMIDPFPIAPPRALLELVQPVAESLGLPTLGLHFHEVLFAFGLYTIVGSVVSPAISPRICPNVYPKLNKRTRLSWDVHVVSLVQSILISVLSLYSIFCDEERKELRLRANWEARVWEYTGMGGLLQSFALGYFVWDLIMCAMHVDIFGWGMLAHAVSAVSVFALGYVRLSPRRFSTPHVSLTYDSSVLLSTSTHLSSYFTSFPPPSSTSTGSVINWVLPVASTKRSMEFFSLQPSLAVAWCGVTSAASGSFTMSSTPSTRAGLAQSMTCRLDTGLQKS